jgi:hypothetical protein
MEEMTAQRKCINVNLISNQVLNKWGE